MLGQNLQKILAIKTYKQHRNDNINKIIIEKLI